MMSDAIFEITLEKFTYGGDAMGRLPDGRAVFVPFGLPNEIVKIRLTQEKQNFARGEIIEIIKTSPERIKAKCKHFFSPLLLGEGLGVRSCGGCHYQNLSYENQLKAKTEILKDQLQRIGKIENPPIQKMIPSPDEWNYRNHVQFHLTDKGKLGYIFSPLLVGEGLGVRSIEECHLPEKEIDSFWKELNFESNLNLERASLRNGDENDLMLILESESPETPELEIEADISVIHLYENHPIVIAGQDHIFIKVLDKVFKVSASSFFQVNTKMAEKMVEHLQTCLPVSVSTCLLDIYCGVGLFSKFFANKYQKVIGIESSPSACEDFVFNLDEFENIDLYEGSAEEILPKLEKQVKTPTHVIVDPPRSGIDKLALDAIIKLKPQVIAYVSCDPSTLARDAARLINGGYKLKQVTPFDLFPQTYHIESISIFHL
ncbi:MAG: class I SAM-dependent RNA methyltransferase [Anaerolineales bacterium]|nr:class I SAM-dependent RNA methyltransferase [Anaerolineales bacterium]